jgi:hypothetical protein
MSKKSLDPKFLEIEKLDKEMKILRDKIKNFQKRKKELHTEIVDELQENNKESWVFSGIKYVLEEKTIKGRKKEADKKKDINGLLQKLEDGELSAEELYEQVLLAMRGPETTKILIKAVKN